MFGFSLGVRETTMISSSGDEIPTEVETRASLDADVLLWNDVWSLLLVVLQCSLPKPAASVVES